MRLLLINPNTSTHITARLAASARRALGAGDRLEAITADTGPAVVACADSLAQAQSSALAMAAAHAQGHNALVLGISLDQAAPLLRQAHPSLAVVGMTEAALLTASLRVQRLGLLTLGASLLPLYRQRVAALGLDGRVVACEAPDAPLAFLQQAQAVDPAVLEILLPACQRLQAAGAQAIVLAGAVLCGYARALASRTQCPTFDGVECAVWQARVLLETAA